MLFVVTYDISARISLGRQMLFQFYLFFQFISSVRHLRLSSSALSAGRSLDEHKSSYSVSAQITLGHGGSKKWRKVSMRI